ncbi:hypothetical protein TRIUR3_14409 [Triticum urartu]|uniref:Uncharacterized protein n=1 Tax=Triticum urartu TaxID=4572 RepID=M7ZRK8_TRIUA|nr:hypothetical protein TRIUR3_14409 [Triticum urartu]
MLRVHGSFPSFSPDAKYLALNGDFFKSPGVTILRADGSKRWVLAKQPNLFYTSWSPSESGVVFTSAGPIFETPKATVRVSRIEFDPSELTDDRGDVDVAVKELTRPEAGNDAFPAVSPCGRRFVLLLSNKIKCLCDYLLSDKVESVTRLDVCRQNPQI